MITMSKTLGRTAHFAAKSILKEFANNKLDLSFEHYITLDILSGKDGIIQQDLAKEFSKDKSSILHFIDTLESEGLVERIGDLIDRRKKVLQITKKGNLLLKKAHEIEKNTFDKLLSGLPKDDIEAFTKVCDGIHANAKKYFLIGCQEIKN